eukprot:TRINITY_DN2815_c0_g2_i1.p1 TRINITY_DN2815_c0_g2~~TRINITY_DN2815_c0_g2_i1.p1  ORF type:complete len:150 (+),score=29.39 TRINITY_DN2815_c0_g2_i1:59-508(+)
MSDATVEAAIPAEGEPFVPPTENPLVVLEQEMAENKKWQLTSEELIKKEENRIEKASAVARGYEREYIRCSQKYQGNQQKLEKHCLEFADKHMTWLASAYCPLPFADYLRCKQSGSSDCNSELASFRKCSSTYAQIARLHLDYRILGDD